MTPEEMKEVIPEGRYTVTMEVKMDAIDPGWVCEIQSEDGWKTRRRISLREGMDQELMGGGQMSYVFDILPGQIERDIHQGIIEVMEAEHGLRGNEIED